MRIKRFVNGKQMDKKQIKNIESEVIISTIQKVNQRIKKQAKA